MESIQAAEGVETTPPAKPGRVRVIVGQFNWRIVLIRVLVNALTLILISVLLPEIYFADRRLLNVLFLAFMLGILNAFVKPIIQFLTLPFIFATYGLVVVAINTLMLMLLALVFPARFVVGSLFWAIIGGALMGLIASVLESLFGLNLPIVPKRSGSDGQEALTAPRPSPVETLLFEGLAGHEEAELVPEDELGATPTGEATAAEEAMARREAMAAGQAVATEPEATTPPADLETPPVHGPLAGERSDETEGEAGPTQLGDPIEPGEER